MLYLQSSHLVHQGSRLARKGTTMTLAAYGIIGLGGVPQRAHQCLKAACPGPKLHSLSHPSQAASSGPRILLELMHGVSAELPNQRASKLSSPGWCSLATMIVASSIRREICFTSAHVGLFVLPVESFPMRPPPCGTMVS